MEQTLLRAFASFAIGVIFFGVLYAAVNIGWMLQK
jgi:hypothetical protein